MQIYEDHTIYLCNGILSMLPNYSISILKSFRPFLLRLKDKFFDILKLWLLKAKSSIDKLRYL